MPTPPQPRRSEDPHDSVPLREYVEGLVSALRAEVEKGNESIRREVKTALEATDKATVKSETASEKRFESVNEFRKSLTDQTNTFIPRVEAEQRIKAVSDKVDGQGQRIDKIEGNREGGDRAEHRMGDGWRMMALFIGGLVGVAGLASMVVSALKTH
jgi:hypothetical protein